MFGAPKITARQRRVGAMMIDTQVWRDAWSLLLPKEKRRAKKVFAIVIVTAILAAAMVASIMPFLVILSDPSAISDYPLLTKFYDRFEFQSSYSFLITLGTLALIVNLLASLSQIARSYAIFHFSARQTESFSSRLISIYLRQPYVFFLDRHTGELSTKVLAVSQQVTDLFYRPAAEIVAAICSALAVLMFVFWVAPIVSLACMVVLGGIYGTTYLVIRRRIKTMGQMQHAANLRRYRVTSEALGGIKALKIRGRETAYINRFRDPARRIADVQKTSGALSEIPGFVLQALAFGGIILLGLALLDPATPENGNGFNSVLPTVGLFAFAGQRLLPELQRIYIGFTQMQMGTASVAALKQDLSLAAPSSETDGDAGPMIGLRNSIDIRNVCYRYPNSDTLRLNDVSLTVKAGERIGIVGTTGAGKSTLADLVLGLIQPDTGTLSVDGIVIDQDNVTAWRRSLGYVPQDIFLIDGTISENVALGDAGDDIDLDRVKDACRVAQLSTFIETDLEQQYDTVVGERGVRLSGGQRQRIGVARAMYDNPDLLVFDEATSALDTITENEIIEAIDTLQGDKTILIIAHRLTTVRHCDRIIVLDAGRIAESGTWDELVKNGQLFQKLAVGNKRDNVG